MLVKGGPCVTVYFRIIQLHEFGILDKLQTKYYRWLREDPCGPDSTATSEVLALKDIWPLFVLVAAGFGVSLVMLGLEAIANLFRLKPVEIQKCLEEKTDPSAEIQPLPGPSGLDPDSETEDQPDAEE